MYFFFLNLVFLLLIRRHYWKKLQQIVRERVNKIEIWWNHIEKMHQNFLIKYLSVWRFFTYWKCENEHFHFAGLYNVDEVAFHESLCRFKAILERKIVHWPSRCSQKDEAPPCLTLERHWILISGIGSSYTAQFRS